MLKRCKNVWVWNVVQLVEHLSSMCKDLYLTTALPNSDTAMLTCNPSTGKLRVGSHPNKVKDISQHHSNGELGAGIISSKE